MPFLTPESRVFSGQYHHAIDDKNRVTVPAPWRLGPETEEFFIVPDQSQNFLLVLPPAEFKSVSDVVNANDKISPHDKRKFIRQFYSRAKQCTTDRQGRILIPDDHRQQVGMGAEAVLVGVHDRFEIWNPDRWAQSYEEDTSTYQQVANLVGL